ncbi:ABC transporter ATP-binding protein [Nonomuraea soli]|uniref:ABC-2 type transport system ATP-binding protein n=1 Tax=Nonomuraea soli TaxID=1032476 RepID=A0A7W0HPU5_9ACTN|nr:ABC transporter ATP-binding protein [Nonomuraea soli]MBA2891249.1 ABC-2 type transport system ATP-binding protein [Nonomuraea soli]
MSIVVEGLSRSFGGVRALDDVSFEVASGEVVALLGVNGAGKTTLTKILSTLLLPGGGSARIMGHDVVGEAKACRSVTGVVFGGDGGLYGRLSGRDNLRFFAMLAGLGRRGLRARVDDALERVGLGAAADRAVQTYSKGMRQRLHLAVGFIASPQVLLLDEPTVGLDVIEAQRLRDTVRDLRTSGLTVLLTSHLLVDVEQLADRVLLLQDGRIAEDLPLASFTGLAGYAALVVVRGRGPHPVPRDATVAVDGDTWELSLRVRRWDASVFAELGQELAGYEVSDLSVREVRLEDAFTKLATA